jgi:hypothetical protein
MQHMTGEQTMTHTAEALQRATTSQSFANYPAIIEGFAARGIPPEQIRPRENVFTFNAWRQLSRTVKKGETGVKITTWIPVEKNGEKFVRPKLTTVFHITQTQELAK